MGREGLAYGTVNGYRSAVSKWIQDSTLSNEANPANGVGVHAVLEGIKREQASQRVRDRLAKPPPTPLTPHLLLALRPVLRPESASPEQIMIWAALSIGVHGLLRPNEFLGHYRDQSRALVRNQCQFINRVGQPQELSSTIEPPARLRIDLLITKADQSGRNPPIEIDDASAVSAMWEWMQIKRPHFQAAPGVFHLPDEARGLSCTRLTTTLNTAAATLGLTLIFKGKSLRRGGATGALLAGATPQQVQAKGRWKGARMVDVYTNSHEFNELATVTAANTAAAAMAAK